MLGEGALFPFSHRPIAAGATVGAISIPISAADFPRSVGEDSVVPTAYQVLLDAALEHLADLQRQGARYVPVTPGTLDLLAKAVVIRPKSRATSVPASPVLTPVPVPVPPTAPASAPGIPDIPPLTAPVADRNRAMAELRERALVCQCCPNLVRSRIQVVFGVGLLEAELMFVGEAPGADEDRLGEPFVGKAGQLLTKLIGAMGFSRETVYIANVLKCRPDLPPGQWGNRAPRSDEMATCLPYLVRQIEIIRPRAIVALGGTAVKGLLGRDTPIGSLRGRWHDFQGIPLMPTFHPAYLLRCEDGPDKGFAEKRKAWEDMLQVLTRLDRSITDRMRGYFLRAPAA